MSGTFNNENTFEKWADLASSDPQGFEKLRRDKISALIERASGPRQRRLRGLQWKIDQIRNKNSNMAACLAISELMWETFEHLAEMLQSHSERQQRISVQRQDAKIIPFPDKSKANT